MKLKTTDPELYPMYDIPAYRLDKAIAKIDAANRRAVKAGVPGRITYTYEPFLKERKDDDTGLISYEERVMLTILVPEVKHQGWTFVATLSWDEEAGLITRPVPDSLPFERPTDCHCDVCHTIRNRKDTYVVIHEDGRQLQVGSNCLMQFLGITPGDLWMLNWADSFDEDGDPDDDMRHFRSNRRFNVADVLAATLAVVYEQGWLSKAAAQEGKGIATAATVHDIMTGWMPTGKGTDEIRALYNRIRSRIPELRAEAEIMHTEGLALDGASEYILNLQTLLRCETVDMRNLGLIVSTYAATQRNRSAKAQADTEASEFLGAVGDKLQSIEAEVIGVRFCETEWGMSTLLVFKAEKGLIKWFASGRHDYVKEGDKVLVSGTIKKLEVYNGKNQTVITRAKVVEVEASPAA